MVEASSAVTRISSLTEVTAMPTSTIVVWAAETRASTSRAAMPSSSYFTV
jgi:hypothetical protein